MGLKYVVFLIGSNGSGKTTQSKMLIDALATDDAPQEISGEGKKPWCYTLYPKSGLAVLGKMGENQCTGLDSVYGKLGADGVTLALQKALEDRKVSIILVECVFGTVSWYNKWIAAGLREKFSLLVVHLELSLWENFKRIGQRRAKKTGGEWYEEHLPDTVYKNVGSKNRETRNIYLKLAGNHPTGNCPRPADHAVQIKATFNQAFIHKAITKAITRMLND